MCFSSPLNVKCSEYDLRATHIISSQLRSLDNEELEITTYLAVKISEDLNYACSITPSMWGSDVLIASRLLIVLLEYESHQEGLNLTHRQDRHYIQVIQGIGVRA